MRFHNLLAAAALMVASLFSSAHAAPISYKLQGQLDGLIGSTPISSEPFVWTLTADTASEFMYFPGVFLVPAITNTIETLDFGTLSPTLPFFVFFQPGVGQDGFFAFNFTGGMSFTSPQLAPYLGATPIGPIGVNLLFNFPFATDQGPFSITAASDLTFQAIGGNVPEPLTLTLFGAGLAGIGAMRRRKAKI